MVKCECYGGTKTQLLLLFSRDYVLVICSAVIVCATLLISSADTLIRLMSVSNAEEVLEQSKSLGRFVLFYYITLAMFLLVCVLVLGYFCVRFLWELSILRIGVSAEHGKWVNCCFVRVLKVTLYVAVILLLCLFGAFWSFWGQLLQTLSWRMQIALAKLAHDNKAALRALEEAANRTFLVVVFFVLSISLNILTLTRQLLNKTVLLRNSRGSIFRVVHVDLQQVASTPTVFRQLFMAFLFDLIELWTLATWIVYPVIVAVFWALEKECVESDLVVSVESISPLIGCMYAARYHLMGVALGWCALVTATSLMYLLRYLDERRKLFAIDSKPRWWHVSPFVLCTGLLFLSGIGASVISVLMCAKPLLSSLDEAKRIYMAVPGVVLMCGSILLVLHIGKKLQAAWRFRQQPHISFFFERGCALSGRVGGVAPDVEEGEELEALDDVSAAPYIRAVNDDILY